MVVCDNSFTLYVNGQKVGTGNDFKTAFLFDLRSALKPGENLFAVDAVNHLNDNTPPPETGDIPAGAENPAGLIFYARLRSDHGVKTNDFISDNTWLWSAKRQPNWQKPEFDASDWKPAVKLGEMGMIPWRVTKDYVATRIAASYPGQTRAALVAADPLTTALGRPNREQVVTTRPCEATTLQALEMTNGETLDEVCRRGAKHLLAESSSARDKLVPALCQKALGRRPTAKETALAHDLTGEPVREDGLEDLLWSLAMLPEFQLIY
jgi:hypothetical protein